MKSAFGGNIKKVLVGTAAGAFMLGASIVPAFATNIVSNGSFETGILQEPFTEVYPGWDNIGSWKVVSGSVDYIGSYWEASDGARSIDMSGRYEGAISQDLTTTPGAIYNVTFDMAGNTDGGPVVKEMDVDTGGTHENFTFDNSGTTKEDMGWTSKSFSFTANSSSTSLTFTSKTPGWSGPALDNVVVEQYLPIREDDCKNDDWEAFGVFKNQGDCVSFVETNGRNLPAGE
ncbi:MAG: choice-of-anchor C family protein [bacterium]|nr:choice-of-anchor C family protein [bacterium]